MTNKDYGPATEAKIAEVMQALDSYGRRSIVALAGVPGTGKSFVASIAAQRFATDPLMVREVQFHQSFSYEEFIEGLRIDNRGAVSVKPGIFLELNRTALEDDANQYVLLIEELTRANLSAVLGELLTYLEYREGEMERHFETIYSRQPISIAPKLAILATYNPVDQSALDLDAAVLRRLRVISCPPSQGQLAEMLSGKLAPHVIAALKRLFQACRDACKSDFEFEHTMPFGHAVFAEVRNEFPDLHQLWHQRLIHLLRRPYVETKPLTDVIEKNYPWIKQDYREPPPTEGENPGS